MEEEQGKEWFYLKQNKKLFEHKERKKDILLDEDTLKFLCILSHSTTSFCIQTNKLSKLKVHINKVCLQSSNRMYSFQTISQRKTRIDWLDFEDFPFKWQKQI